MEMEYKIPNNPPEGFREMDKGEIVQEDSLYLSTSGSWMPVPGPCVGAEVGAREVRYAAKIRKFRQIDDV